MRDFELLANEESKIILLSELVRRRASYSFSDMARWANFPRFKSDYQLRKALVQLENDGLIHKGFKGHNRYGYAWWRANEKGCEFIEAYNAKEKGSK